MSLSLSSEQLTYIYETLHDRKTMKIFKDSKQQKRLCEKVMSLIEEEILTQDGEVDEQGS
jgi:hypothetical protein